MAKTTYTNLKIKVDTSIATVKHGESEIEVLQYLPAEDKMSLVNLTLQGSYKGGIHDSVALDTLFHVYLIYMYTNITFTDKQKENPFKIYDTFKSTGLLDEILKAIPDTEYNSLLHFLEETMEKQAKFYNSFAGFVQGLLDALPEQAGKAVEMLNNFDMNKYQDVLNFAQSINGDRAI